MVKLMLTLVVFFGFVLQQYVMVDMIWPEARRYLVERRQMNPALLLPFDLALRALLVLVASERFSSKCKNYNFLCIILVIIAISVPNLGQIISFVGITSGNLLAFIFPAIIHTLTFAPSLMAEKKANGEIGVLLCKNGFLALMGLFGLVAGLRAQIKAL